MQLENYGNFPQTIPLIIEDEIFLYPFMITPLFLENQENIKAVENAIENIRNFHKKQTKEIQ